MELAYINISLSKEGNVELLEKRQLHTMLYKRELSKSVNVHYLLRSIVSFEDRSPGLQIIAQDLSVARFIWFVYRYAVTNKIRVIIFHSLNPFFCAPFFRMVPGLKVIMQHHGETLFLHKKSVFMRFTDPFVTAYFFHGKGNALPFARRGYLKMEKVFEIPEGSTDFIPASAPVNLIPKIIFIGRLDENKGLITLLKAIVILTDIDLMLDVYFSDDSQLNQMRDFCTRHFIGQRVEFKGKVAPERIHIALQQSDVFVSCSKYEAGGYSLIEALACGTYPVVTKIPAFDFVLEGLEFKKQFPVDDAEALAECLKQVINIKIDARVRDSIRAHFEKNVSPRAIADSILKVISELQTG